MAGTWTEDEIGRKWDRCFTDAVLKLGGGVFLGSVFSLLFFRTTNFLTCIMSFGLSIGLTEALSYDHWLNTYVQNLQEQIRSICIKIFKQLTRKKWPIITGGGFGLGMAYSNCEKDINATLIQNRPQGRKCEEKKK